jgi:hypothetical protein
LEDVFSSGHGGNYNVEAGKLSRTIGLFSPQRPALIGEAVSK